MLKKQFTHRKMENYYLRAEGFDEEANDLSTNISALVKLQYTSVILYPDKYK